MSFLSSTSGQTQNRTLWEHFCQTSFTVFPSGADEVVLVAARFVVVVSVLQLEAVLMVLRLLLIHVVTVTVRLRAPPLVVAERVPIGPAPHEHVLQVPCRADPIGRRAETLDRKLAETFLLFEWKLTLLSSCDHS